VVRHPAAHGACGLPSLLVAVLGIAAPFALGWAVGALLLPDRSIYVHAFLGAMLAATSVGITARVLQDLGRSTCAEARVILGAAVIDDVLGLVILAVVGGLENENDSPRSLALQAAQPRWTILELNPTPLKFRSSCCPWRSNSSFERRTETLGAAGASPGD